VAARIEELRRLALTEHQRDGCVGRVGGARSRAPCCWWRSVAGHVREGGVDERARSGTRPPGTGAGGRLDGTDALPPGLAVETIAGLIDRSQAVREFPARLRLGSNRRGGPTGAGAGHLIECALLDAPSGASVSAWQEIAKTFLREGIPRGRWSVSRRPSATADPRERPLLALGGGALGRGATGEAGAVRPLARGRRAGGPPARTPPYARPCPAHAPLEPEGPVT
jgi:hypothetical protein